MWAGVQNVSRPIERCHEMSQWIPTIAEVSASTHSQMCQGAARRMIHYPISILVFTTKFTSMEEISDLIAHFEIGDAKPWTHAAHLTMAFWYLSRMDETQATERIRSGILHYNECQGTANTDVSGYHETLTIFWIRIVATFLKEADGSWSALEVA